MPERKDRHTNRARLVHWLVILTLLAFLGHVLTIANATSLTVDEGLHVASGYTVWRTGDYRLVEEHPPFAKLWLALPLLPMRSLPDPTQLPAWETAATPTTESLPLLQIAQQLLFEIQPVDSWLFPARVMAALLGVLVLAVIHRWGRDLTSPAGALVALFLATLDPGLLAHSAVAGTDMGAALLIALSLWQAGRFLEHPTTPRALVLGLVLGLALATKLTALLLGPVLLVMGMSRLLVCPSTRSRLLALTAITLVTCVLAFWAVYGFQVGYVPGVPFPLPAAAHAIPVQRLQSHTAGGHQAFLLGDNRIRGWWIYFPAAFLMKTPLPALLAMVAGWIMLGYRSLTQRSGGPAASRWWHLGPALLFGLLYGLSSLFSPLNIGYRHLLPLLPLLYSATGAVAACAWSAIPWRGRAVGRGAIAVLLIWQAGTVLTATPHLIGYFNELTGGSTNGWRYLADSNTDWGQGYKALAAYQEDHATGPVKLAAFIFYDPALYGVDYEALPPMRGDTPAVFPSRFAPPPGNYVISATPLDGIPLSDPEMYDWFRWRQPDAQIANALHYYEVTAAETATTWVAQCSTPTPPLTAATLAEGFGQGGSRSVDRVLAFDCTRAWVYPASVSQPGVYVLHGSLLDDSLAARLHLEAPVPTLPTAARHLGGAHITYRQRAYREAPAFAIYRMQEAPALPDGASRPAPAESMLSDVQHQPEQEAPVALEGPLAFIGARAYSYDEGLEVESWWQVVASPTPRPFSIMGHLLAADGTVLGVDDGLGLDPASLQEGDILVEVHRYETQAQVDELWFRTGAYWLDSLERWSVGDGNADAIFVRISSLR